MADHITTTEIAEAIERGTYPDAARALLLAAGMRRYRSAKVRANGFDGVADAMDQFADVAEECADHWLEVCDGEIARSHRELVRMELEAWVDMHEDPMSPLADGRWRDDYAGDTDDR